MDFIRKYDIELEKEQYYAGETLRGCVVIENAENLRITGVQVGLRGKAHVEWRITRGGERRTVKEDQFFIDKKIIVWGKDAEAGDDGAISILERGEHRLPFEFQLPDTRIPCSFESRIGTVRYYLRVIIYIPYASPPQGLKYFTVIGPHIDCLDERYSMPLSASRQSKRRCVLCACSSGPVSLEAWLERGAYCCGEYIRLKCDVTNGSDQDATLACRLVQYVEYRINKGALGMNKDVTHHVLEYHSAAIPAHSNRSFYELHRELQVPVMPPTLADICRVIEINYVLKVAVHMEKSGEDLQVEFPFIVATVPFREPGGTFPEITYEPADDHVEGGIYISPEFQLGQVYDGAADVVEDVILYRPVYVCAPRPPGSDIGNGHSPSVRGVERTPSPGARRNNSPGGGSLEQVNSRASPAHPRGGRTAATRKPDDIDVRPGGEGCVQQQQQQHGGSSGPGHHHSGGSGSAGGRATHEIVVRGILQTTSPERRPASGRHDLHSAASQHSTGAAGSPPAAAVSAAATTSSSVGVTSEFPRSRLVAAAPDSEDGSTPLVVLPATAPTRPGTAAAGAATAAADDTTGEKPTQTSTTSSIDEQSQEHHRHAAAAAAASAVAVTTTKSVTEQTLENSSVVVGQSSSTSTNNSSTTTHRHHHQLEQVQQTKKTQGQLVEELGEQTTKKIVDGKSTTTTTTTVTTKTSSSSCSESVLLVARESTTSTTEQCNITVDGQRVVTLDSATSATNNGVVDVPPTTSKPACVDDKVTSISAAAPAASVAADVSDGVEATSRSVELARDGPNDVTTNDTANTTSGVASKT